MTKVVVPGFLNSLIFSPRKPIVSHFLQCLTKMRFASTKSLVQTGEEVYSVEADAVEETTEDMEREIERKRDKSRLYPQHLNILKGKPPYNEEKADFHGTLKYKRRMFGRYGSESRINPGTLWPTKNEIEEILEYERVAYPHSIQEMITQEISKKEKEQAFILERQNKIVQNLKKLNDWKKDIERRVAKKESDAAAAKKKKDDLIEEVRRHFGFKIDPKDERFKEVLQQKERDQKKKLKEEKTKAKQEKILASMIKAEEEK